jgi:hypothetical protein
MVEISETIFLKEESFPQDLCDDQEASVTGQCGAGHRGQEALVDPSSGWFCHPGPIVSPFFASGISCKVVVSKSSKAAVGHCLATGTHSKKCLVGTSQSVLRQAEMAMMSQVT